MWSGVDAIAFNIHTDSGEWLESISGDATQWTASENGSYYIVATNEQGWESWGRSNTVVVDDIAINTAEANNATVPSVLASSVLTDFSSTVYSSSAAEIFWSVDGDGEQYQFELEKNGVLQFSGSARSFFDDQLAAGNTYQYSLKVLRDGSVLDQQELELATQGTQDGQAERVQLRGQVYSQSAVELTWDRSTHPDSAQFNYNLYQDEQLLSSSDALSLYVDGLTPGQTYQFTLRVLDANGLETEGYSISLTTRTAN